MCGVVALFLKRPLDDNDIRLGKTLTASLRHRGPNAEGVWIDRDQGVFLGHRRLAIIDLTEASNQPMVRGDSAFSYNGELYNFRAIRNHLIAKGARFTTEGDSEVMLQAWRHLGTAMFDMLDGMFAFALWDKSGGWLAVDRFGEKQLYYAETDDGLLVSSELAPLVRMLGLRPELSERTLTPFVSLGYVPAPETFFPAVRRLPPGHYLRVENGQAGRPTCYWRPQEPERRRSPVQPLDESGLDELQAALIASIEGRLESDAPACLFLSAGIDSSLIAAIMARDLKREVDCITVSFRQGNTHDEAADAAAVASVLGLPHRVLDSQGVPNDIDAEYLLNMFGQPNENLTVASVHQMAKAASTSGYRMGLTGMGGDEIFLGYQKHAFFYQNRRYFNLPEGARRWLSNAIRPFAGLSSKLATFRDVCAVPDSERYLTVKNLPAISALRRLPAFDAWSEKLFRSDGGPIELRVPLFDLQNTMVNSQLPALDLGSMRAGLELRTPFLSKALHDIVAQHDPRAFLAFGQKSVLRRILARYLPERLTARPKRGFIFPTDRFLGPSGNPPPIAGVNEQVIRQIWANRERRGWNRLAVRLVLFSVFAAAHS